MGKNGGGVLVTGASRGIGGEIALELASRGLSVGCISRRGVAPPVPSDSRANSPCGVWGRLVPYSCDVADRKRVSAVVDAFAEEAGGLRAVVNCAGIHSESESATLTKAAFRRIFDINVLGALTVCQSALVHFTKSGHGLIVNIGSFYDRLGVNRSLAYCASKAALASLTRTLAVEWASAGVAAVTLAPGYVRTDLNAAFFDDPRKLAAIESRIPLHRTGAAQEIARLAAALIVEDVPFLTGTTIYVDGAQGVSL